MLGVEEEDGERRAAVDVRRGPIPEDSLGRRPEEAPARRASPGSRKRAMNRRADEGTMSPPMTRRRSCSSVASLCDEERALSMGRSLPLCCCANLIISVWMLVCSAHIRRMVAGNQVCLDSARHTQTQMIRFSYPSVDLSSALTLRSPPASS